MEIRGLTLGEIKDMAAFVEAVQEAVYRCSPMTDIDGGYATVRVVSMDQDNLHLTLEEGQLNEWGTGSEKHLTLNQALVSRSLLANKKMSVKEKVIAFVKWVKVGNVETSESRTIDDNGMELTETATKGWREPAKSSDCLQNPPVVSGGRRCP